MSLFDMFRGTQNASAAQPAPQGQQQTPATPQPLAGGDPSILEARGTADATPPQGDSNKAATPAKSEGEPSPLAGFEKMWDTVDTGKGKMPSLNADPTKISEAAKKLDFSRGVDPAQVQKALAGDTAAFMDVLNTVAQNSFSVATQASTHLVDKHTSAVADFMQSELPSHLKRFQANDSLMSEHPNLANPAVQPLISVIQQQLAAQFPQATSAELRAHAMKYLNGVVAAINPDAASASKDTKPRGSKQSEAQAKGQFDWDTWAKAESEQQSWQ